MTTNLLGFLLSLEDPCLLFPQLFVLALTFIFTVVFLQFGGLRERKGVSLTMEK